MDSMDSNAQRASSVLSAQYTSPWNGIGHHESEFSHLNDHNQAFGNTQKFFSFVSRSCQVCYQYRPSLAETNSMPASFVRNGVGSYGFHISIQAVQASKCTSMFLNHQNIELRGNTKRAFDALSPWH